MTRALLAPQEKVKSRKSRDELGGLEGGAAWGWQGPGFGAGAWRGADRKPSERHPLPDPLPQMQEMVEFWTVFEGLVVWEGGRRVGLAGEDIYMDRQDGDQTAKQCTANGH